MENQSVEDKFSVLQNIFGNDLTDELIAETLKANNDDFDATVEKLLTLPANKPKEVRPTQPQQPQPMDPKSLDNIKRLQNMFGDLTQSVITTVYESNKRDVEGTVDTLLNLTSNEVASGQDREAEVARQEEDIRAYEEFKREQQRLQEEERKQAEVTQQNALQRAKEEEQRKKEEAQRREVEKKAMDEHTRALQEQEKLLLEYQRKKEEQDRAKRSEQERLMKEEQEKTKRAEEAKKEAIEKARVQLEKEKESLEKEKQRLDMLREEKLRVDQERARQLTEERIEKERLEMERRLAEERRLEEEAIALKKLVEQNEILQQKTLQAEAERKLLEARQMKREEEEKKKILETERRFKEEQENIRRDWEEKVRKMENERRMEDQKRVEEEAKRVEAKKMMEEERARQEADMKKVLELERLKLDEQRKKIEEERKSGEARLKAMEDAARQREEEEAQRLKAEEERKMAEEERKREEEERARLLQEEAQARERIKEELRKAIAQEQFAASAIMVDKSVDEPKVDITTELDGADSIKGSWALVQGVLPAQAWLGLFARRAINTNSGYMYISGSSGEFHFKGLTPGHYEVRIFASKPVTTRIAESAPLLVGPRVVNFTLQQQGHQLIMEYSLDPPVTPSSRDWVGLYEKSQRRNKIYLTSVYGNNTGVITMQQPKTAGDYEVRLFVTGAKYNDQASVQFTVDDNDQISGEVVDGVIKAKWVMRTVETTSSDWIGLFAAGGDNNTNNSNKYLVSVYTNAQPEGSIDIPIPKDTPKGLYELRLFASKVGKYVTFKTSDVLTLN